MYWDWVESSSMSKEIATQALLPSSSGSYGQLNVVDNTCPIIQRTFTANNCTRAQVEGFIAKAKTRNSCFTITTSLGTSYTGRFINYAAQQTRGADHWQLSIVLQDVDNEDAASVAARHTYALTDD